MKQPLQLYFDGLCEYGPDGRRNPGGIAAWGWSLVRDGQEITSRSDVIGQGNGMTNNLAEYSALIDGLTYLIEKELNREIVLVMGDSNLVIRQLSGDWQVRKPSIRELYLQADRLLGQFERIELRWIPREQNERADALSREAYDRARRYGVKS